MAGYKTEKKNIRETQNKYLDPGKRRVKGTNM